MNPQLPRGYTLRPIPGGEFELHIDFGKISAPNLRLMHGLLGEHIRNFVQLLTEHPCITERQLKAAFPFLEETVKLANAKTTVKAVTGIISNLRKMRAIIDEADNLAQQFGVILPPRKDADSIFGEFQERISHENSSHS